MVRGLAGTRKGPVRLSVPVDYKEGTVYFREATRSVLASALLLEESVSLLGRH